MKYSRIIKAINEGLDKALMSFDDAEETFDKTKNSYRKSEDVAYSFYQEEAEQRLKSKEGIRYDWFIEQYIEHGFKYIIKDKDELIYLISSCVYDLGPNCNLNWIDVSNITDMSNLFYHSAFNGDISEWDVSNVTDMSGMFGHSKFNGNISKWDVSHVTNMSYMFDESVFNQNISAWNVSNVTKMFFMFRYSLFDNDISDWDVSNAKDSYWMFNGCQIRNEYKPKPKFK